MIVMLYHCRAKRCGVVNATSSYSVFFFSHVGETEETGWGPVLLSISFFSCVPGICCCCYVTFVSHCNMGLLACCFLHCRMDVIFPRKPQGALPAPCAKGDSSGPFSPLRAFFIQFPFPLGSLRHRLACESNINIYSSEIREQSELSRGNSASRVATAAFPPTSTFLSWPSERCHLKQQWRETPPKPCTYMNASSFSSSWLLILFFPQEEKTKVGGVLCCGGKKVPTETHYQGELAKFLSEVGTEERESAGLFLGVFDVFPGAPKERPTTNSSRICTEYRMFCACVLRRDLMASRVAGWLAR